MPAAIVATDGGPLGFIAAYPPCEVNTMSGRSSSRRRSTARFHWVQASYAAGGTPRACSAVVKAQAPLNAKLSRQLYCPASIWKAGVHWSILESPTSTTLVGAFGSP